MLAQDDEFQNLKKGGERGVVGWLVNLEEWRKKNNGKKVEQQHVIVHQVTNKCDNQPTRRRGDPSVS